MNTKTHITLSVLTVLGLVSGSADAAPSFGGMQIHVLCPDFDGAMGPGNDPVLAAAAKRVYQGDYIPPTVDGSACKKFLANGKGGWFTARVTWSSDKNASLYVENTAVWSGTQGDGQWEMLLLLDGNGSALDFDKIYLDPATNIMNEPGLTFAVEVQYKGVWTRINRQRVKPTPWALWALHSGDSADIYAQLSKLDTRITNIINTANKYTDDQLAAEHARLHQEVAAETGLRQQGDSQTLAAADVLADQRVTSEANERKAQDAALQSLLDGKVNSVGATWPVTSSGGHDPVIGLAGCGEGEVLVHKGGKWECSAVGGAQAGAGVYNRNVAECMNNEVLTLQQGCSFALPDCIMPGNEATACPPAPAQCSFVQTDSSNVCVRQGWDCESQPGFCFPTCLEWQAVVCGKCDCTFPKVGSLLNN